MKKSLILSLLALIIFAASCREKEAEYIFSKKFNSANLETETEQLIIDYAKTFEYFQAPSRYFGKYSDVFLKASEEFLSNCKALDEKKITGYLKPGESFGIFLVEDNSGIIAASVIFTPENIEQH